MHLFVSIHKERRMYDISPETRKWFDDEIAGFAAELKLNRRNYWLYIAGYYGLTIPVIVATGCTQLLPTGSNYVIASFQALLAFINLPQFKEKLVRRQKDLETLLQFLEEERVINFIEKVGVYNTGGQHYKIAGPEDFAAYIEYLNEKISGKQNDEKNPNANVSV